MFVRWAGAPGPIIAFYRMAITSAILLPFFVWRGRPQRIQWTRSLLFFPILGGVFSALDLAVWATAMDYTSAANATLISNTAPLWVALAAWFLFGERPRRVFWIGLAVTLLGAAVMVASDFFLHPTLGMGDFIALASGLFYAGYYLATQRGRRHLSVLVYLWIMVTSGAVTMLIANRLLGNPLLGYSTQTYLVFLAAALVTQLMGYFSLVYALGHLPASLVAPTMILQPALSAVLAIPLLGEGLHPAQIGGGLAVLGGIYLVNRGHGG